MNKCKFCGEVLEGEVNYCHNCGKSTKKTPSKRYLKKQEKAKNAKVNYDARLYRVSYKLFSGLFILVGLIACVFYAHYFLSGALENLELTADYINIINKGDIHTKVNDFLPFIEISKLNFVFLVVCISLVLSVFSLFTKKFSWGSLFYKLSAISGLVFFFIAFVLVWEMVPFAVPENLITLLNDNSEMITYVAAGLSLGFLVLGILFSFHFSNPYRPTLYQAHKAIYWGIFTLIQLAYILEIEFINIDKIYAYAYFLMPAYILISGILLLIGKKYRGNIEKLK